MKIKIEITTESGEHLKELEEALGNIVKETAKLPVVFSIKLRPGKFDTIQYLMAISFVGAAEGEQTSQGVMVEGKLFVDFFD